MKGSGFYYEFYNAPKIICGIGCLDEAVKEVVKLGARNVFFVCDDKIDKSSVIDIVRKSLSANKIKIGAMYVNKETNVCVKTLQEMRNVYRVNNCDGIISCGGYRVSNTAKALRLMLSTQVARFEDIKGVDVARQKIYIPFVAIPTSVGLANSVTRSVFVSDGEGGTFEVVSDAVSPKLCIIDPQLTSGLSHDQIITGALDSFAHNIEEFVSKQAIILTKSMNLIAIREVRDNVFKAINDHTDLNAILGLQRAGILAGIGYANAEAGIAHALGTAVARVTDTSREICIGLVLGACMRFNVEHVQSDYAQALYYIVGDDKYASTHAEDRAQMLISTSERMISDLFKEYGLPVDLSEAGVTEENIDKVVEETMKSYAIITNPRNVTKKDVYDIVRSVMKHE